MTVWNYYENGKSERHTLSDLEDYFENNAGLQEQKDQGTDF